ncbi:MAG TPA: bifunctional metallophosphatase/5'-nucleotidase, partial [Burkholderiales bacterium]|nr:bifunctional metallophosphatase/5'-nucleotidase [Burkholderiales bacterium]
MAARLVAILLWALLLSACASTARQDAVAVTIAAINDFHGNLRPPPEPALLDGAPVAAGGSAQLATLLQSLRARSANFAFVSAGDLVGATPLPAAYFDDEPVVESMNAMGLDYNGIGNHEFDWGVAHLRRLQDGGCPAGGCKSGLAFAGARFGILAANVIETSTGKPLFPPYGIKDYGAVKVAFVGVTLKATPLMLSPRAVTGLEFRDEAESVNALVPELERQGVGAIVVLIHQGGFAGGGANGCREPWGPIFELAPRFDKAVRVVVSAHTHQAYVCTVGDKLVTSAGSYGRYLTEIQLRIQGQTLSASAVNHVVRSDAPQDAAQAALVARYANLAGELERVVGRITASITRQANADGESPLGRLIADSQLAATKDAGAVVAFMNAGGIRAPLERKGDGAVTYAEVYAVYPFNNRLVTMSLTGAQILRLLDQQRSSMLQVSRGFTYAWDASR